MQMRTDTDYYARRECQERDLAGRARTVESRCVHLDLARRYAWMIEEARDASRSPVGGALPH